MMWLKFTAMIMVVVAVAETAPTSTEAPLVVVAEGSSPGTSPQSDGPMETTPAPELPKPELYSMKVESHVSSRYATTVVSSRVANPANKSQEVTFAIVIPETAFISGFLMELDGKVYKAYVKEKEEAKKVYDQAVASGIGAAHVAVSARDSNRFTVSVNVEPLSKALFNLTYEELLTRRLDVYNLVLNLHPGQIVRELSVDVDIVELKKINVLRAPELRTGNEVDADVTTNANPVATIEFKNADKTEAHVRFAPTVEQQKEMAKALLSKSTPDKEPHPYSYQPQPKATEEDGLTGQFVVQYDVERDPQGGEVIVYDGYFVHFFAPDNLKALNKHVVFVLDVSGSMYGSKIQQLREAMVAILDDLQPGDFFNLVDFSYNARVFDLNKPITETKENYHSYFNHDDSPPPQLLPPYPANTENIKKAKAIISTLDATGGTNIHEALITALKLTNLGVEKALETTANTTAAEPAKEKTPIPEPIIIFLTDGDPTVGETNPKKILTMVSELNGGAKKASIFSLAFGDDADRGFLKQLALRNSGFLRHIYEAADAAVQLQNFYKQIASPILSNIKFKYPADQIEETTDHGFHILFSGSELVVAGKLISKDLMPNAQVSGLTLEGPIDYIPKILPTPAPEKSKPSLERLWAYLTIKQLLDKKDASIDPEKGPVLESGTTTIAPDGPETNTKKALKIALKYSFVTPLTSLVVVKPNATSAVNAEAASGGPAQWQGAYGAALPLAFSAPSSGVRKYALSSKQSLQRIARPHAFFAPGIPGPPGVGGGAAGFGGGFQTSQDRFDFQSISFQQSSLIASQDDADYVGLTTPFVFYPSTTSQPTTTTMIDLSKYGLSAVQWLKSLFVEPNQVTIPNSKFDRLKSLEAPKDKTDFGACSNSPKGGAGKCVALSACPGAFSLLTDVETFIKHECDASEYLGICCDEQPQQTAAA